MSAFVDDVTIFVSSRDDIIVVTEELARYERISRAKANLEKSEGLQVEAWKATFLSDFIRRSDGPVCIFGVWFVLDLQLERYCLEVEAKVAVQVLKSGWP